MLNTGILDRPDEKGLVQLADLEKRTELLRSDLSLRAVRRRLEWLVLDPASITEEMVHLRHRIYCQPGMIDSVVRIMGAVLAMNRGPYNGTDHMTQEGVGLDFEAHYRPRLHVPVPLSSQDATHRPFLDVILAPMRAKGRRYSPALCF